jgi:CTP:molybdopterin cytidylyltransferase MocA
LGLVVLRRLRVVLRLLGRWCLRRVVALVVRRLLVVMGHPAAEAATIEAMPPQGAVVVLVDRARTGCCRPLPHLGT